MTTKTNGDRATAADGKPAVAGRGQQSRPRASRRAVIAGALVAVVASIALYSVYHGAARAASDTSSGSSFPYAVGQPGVGAQAPDFTLASTAGARLNLASLRNQNVLLYFQEGLSCQPCWDQITDLENHSADLKAAGIDKVVSVTSDPVSLLAQKAQDMGLSTTVLSDTDLAVSKAYHANSFGMMGDSRDGHTFILVRRGGTIAWRADYGGAPKYTMFVPTSGLLADLRTARTSPATNTGTTP